MPEIIQFSNRLSYEGEIQPFRNPATASRPHVVEYVVDGLAGATRDGKKNMAEARAVAALVKAACELDMYYREDRGCRRPSRR